MLIKKPTNIPSSEITPRSTYMRRREFLAAVGAVGGIAVVRGLALGDTLSTSNRMVTTTDALTSKQAVTSYTNYYEFGSDKGDASRNGGAFKPQPWSVTVDGLCAKPGTFTLEEIRKAY